MSSPLSLSPSGVLQTLTRGSEQRWGAKVSPIKLNATSPNTAPIALHNSPHALSPLELSRHLPPHITLVRIPTYFSLLLISGSKRE